MALALFLVFAPLPPALRGVRSPGQSPNPPLCHTPSFKHFVEHLAGGALDRSFPFFFLLTSSCCCQSRQYSTDKGGDGTARRNGGGSSSAPRTLRPGDIFIPLYGRCAGYRDRILPLPCANRIYITCFFLRLLFVALCWRACFRFISYICSALLLLVTFTFTLDGFDLLDGINLFSNNRILS